MKSSVAALFLFATLCLLELTSASRFCETGTWYNKRAKVCEPCRVCPENQVVQRKCGRHMDTKCGNYPKFDFLRPEAVKSAHGADESATDAAVVKDSHHSDIAIMEPVSEKTEVTSTGVDKWYTITLVMIAVLVVTIVAVVVLLLVACFVCKKKSREIVSDPVYTSALLNVNDSMKMTKPTQFKVIAET